MATGDFLFELLLIVRRLEPVDEVEFRLKQFSMKVLFTELG